MKVYVFIGIIVLILGVLGFVFLQNNKEDSLSIAPQDSSQYGILETRPADEGDNKSISGIYQGRVLAGSTTPYIDFNQNDYEKALSEGKIVLLNFYADWCPICRAEEPELLIGFEELKYENVVAFRVNFKDSNTDEYEKNLAEQFQIPYQHSKVFVLDDTELSKFIATRWSRDQLISEIGKVAQ